MINIDSVGRYANSQRPFMDGKRKGDFQQEFLSVGELHAFLETDLGQNPKKHDTSAKINRLDSSTSNGRGESWDLGAGWENSMQMAWTGWEDGADKLRLALDKLDGYTPSTELQDEADGMQLEAADEGEMFVAEEYFDGEELYMRDIRFKVHKPLVRICCNVTASCGVDARDMLARGVVIAATARKLERLGYGVQIWTALIEENGAGTTAHLVRVKDSCEYIDDRTLAFWLAHPGAFRRIGFRLLETTPSYCGVSCNYGIPSDFRSKDFDLISSAAHLERALSEKWHNNPEKAAQASIDFVEEILTGHKTNETEEE